MTLTNRNAQTTICRQTNSRSNLQVVTDLEGVVVTQRHAHGTRSERVLSPVQQMVVGGGVRIQNPESNEGNHEIKDTPFPVPSALTRPTLVTRYLIVETREKTWIQ